MYKKIEKVTVSNRLGSGVYVFFLINVFQLFLNILQLEHHFFKFENQ